MKPIIVIPARSGSKRLPRKNLKLLGDKPLIMHTVDFARNNFSDNQICVSTDDIEIIDIVQQSGLIIPFIRPTELASDTASSQDVVKHASTFYSEKLGIDHDCIILLQPTTPFRLTRNLSEGIDLFNQDTSVDMVVSVKETKSNPYYMLFEEDSLGYLRVSKSIDSTKSVELPKVWEYNGSMYFINRSSLFEKRISDFTKIKKLVMDSIFSIDIDTELDFKMAEIIRRDLLE